MIQIMSQVDDDISQRTIENKRSFFKAKEAQNFDPVLQFLKNKIRIGLLKTDPSCLFIVQRKTKI